MIYPGSTLGGREIGFKVQYQPNKVLQRTRLDSSGFPWRSVRAAELGRYVA